MEKNLALPLKREYFALEDVIQHIIRGRNTDKLIFPYLKKNISFVMNAKMKSHSVSKTRSLIAENVILTLNRYKGGKTDLKMEQSELKNLKLIALTPILLFERDGVFYSMREDSIGKRYIYRLEVKE